MTPKRVDANQAEIVAELRAIGARVEHLHEVGDGCPDIMVAWHGNYLFEIKTEGGKLNAKQVEWHEDWRAAGGQVDVIVTSREALVIMGLAWEEDYGEDVAEGNQEDDQRPRAEAEGADS